MLIDMHMHTTISSECSKLEPEQLIKRAKELGLDAVCITEHDKIYGAKYTKELAKKYDFKVFEGVEVTTNIGHVLVYGLDIDFEENIHIEKLIDIVNKNFGIFVAAHPFRENSLSVNNILFDYKFEFIEAYNGNTSIELNKKTFEIAKKHGFKAIAGSDAHTVENIGRCFTKFNKNIENIRELVEELKKGNFTIHFNNELNSLKNR